MKRESKIETMKFTTQSGLELEATMPTISSGQYFVQVNGVNFQMSGDKLKTVFESSVAKFMASINRTCPIGMQCVALQIDEKTQKELRAFICENAPSVKSKSMTRDQFNGEEGGITYHGTHEMWNGVRMD